MKSVNHDPGKKQGQNQGNHPSANLKTGKKSVYSDVDSDRSRNYKGGDDPVNGPNWDLPSRDEDGGTGANTGFYK